MKSKVSTQEVITLSQNLPEPSLQFINWVCASELKQLQKQYADEGKKHIVVNYKYYSMTTTCKNWQVNRHFVVKTRYSEKIGLDLILLLEVSQRWLSFDENNNLQLFIFEKQRAAFWHNRIIPFSLGADLSLKKWSTECHRGGRTQFSYNDEDIYPIRKFTKGILEKGLDRCLLREDEIDIYRYYSTNNIHKLQAGLSKKLKVSVPMCGEYGYLPKEYETLLKIGQKDIARRLIECGDDTHKAIMRRYNTILVAIRHHYDVNQDFWTYLHYLDDLELAGKDMHNPKFIAPADFTKANNEIIRIAGKIRLKKEQEKRQRMLERQREQFIMNPQDVRYHQYLASNPLGLYQANAEQMESKYQERMGKWFTFSITDEKWDIEPLKRVEDFFNLGYTMHQCLATNRYYERYSSLILSAKNKNGEVIENLEISLSDYRIVQCRGICNGITEHHDEIINLVNANMTKVIDWSKKRRRKAKTSTSKIAVA